MIAETKSIQSSLNRQINHWVQAAAWLSSLKNLASEVAWHGIDSSMRKVLEATLRKSINDVSDSANQIKREFQNIETEEEFFRMKRKVTALREQYLKTEQTIHFYTIAVNSRTTPQVAALLRACDIMCFKSMEEILKTLGKEIPPVLTYIDKGIGASILKAGLRLWDGNISPVAAVKITQHNLFRPTAIIHETGHQVAHMLNWNDELAQALRLKLTNHPEVVGGAFASWASEIGADAFAFVHAGFGSIAALHDVVSGRSESVFAFRPNDPHPISYVRVLMGLEMCRQSFGSGPWDELETAFISDYDIDKVKYPSVRLIRLCVTALPDAVKLILKNPFRSFGGRSLTQIIDPVKVSPKELEKLEYIAGPALFTSHAWIWKESIRLLALIGYKIGVGKEDISSQYKLQEELMIKLGFSVELN